MPETQPRSATPPEVADPVAAQIVALVARSKSLDPATLTPDTSFDSLEVDSLDKINLTFEVEELYDISIPDEALNQLRTVGDVVAGVKSLLAAKSAAPTP